MRRLTLRERDTIQIGSSEGLTEDEAAGFSRLQAVMPAGSLSWEHRALRFGPFCGVLRAGNVMVELLPKIGDDQDSVDAARGMLVSMLRITNELSLSKTGEASLGQQRLHLLDHFILDFCRRLGAGLRGGAIVRYQEHEENRNSLRGRLRVTEHLTRNTFDQSRLFCSFDDRTVDNPHNRALKAVLVRLRPLAFAAGVKGTVAGLLHRFGDVADVPATPRDIARLTFDRMTRGWQPIFEHAFWLLRRLFPDVRLGAIDGSCLLFNMERLFERFIGAKFQKAWTTHGANHFCVELQGPTRYLAQSNDMPAFRLRPDITILEVGSPIRILDAKWKRLETEAFGFGIAPTDVYQMVSYAARYECSRVALIYPASKDDAPGLVNSFRIGIPNAPMLEVHAVDVRALARGGALPSNLQPPQRSEPVAVP